MVAVGTACAVEDLPGGRLSRHELLRAGVRALSDCRHDSRPVALHAIAHARGGERQTRQTADADYGASSEPDHRAERVDEAGDRRSSAHRPRKDPSDLRSGSRGDEATAYEPVPERSRQTSGAPPVPALRRDDRAPEESADAPSRL